MNDPLLHCLLYIARSHGQANSPDALRAGLPLPDGRLNRFQLPLAAERAGLISRETDYALAELPQAVLPAMLLLQDQGACVLLESDEDVFDGDPPFVAGVGDPLTDLLIESPSAALESFGVFFQGARFSSSSAGVTARFRRVRCAGGISGRAAAVLV